MYNKVILVGTVGQNPELKKVSNDTSFVSISLAINKKIKNEIKTDWFKCVFFGKVADSFSKAVKKGSSVVIEGSLSQRTWVGKDGKKNDTTEINVFSWDFFNTFYNKNKQSSPSVEPDVSISLPESEEVLLDDDDIPF